MSKTDAAARAGEGLSPAQEVAEAVMGFVTEFKGYEAELQTRLQQTEERLTMLDRKTMTAARTPLAGAAEIEAPRQKAFNAYVRSGEDDGLRGLELEGKAMSTAVNSDGGYLVDPVTSETVKSVLNATASIRSIATVVNVEASSYDVLVDHGEMGTGWAIETGAVTETSTPMIDRISIPLHELSALPKASQRLLDDSAFDIEAWLADRIADKFATAEAEGFLQRDIDGRSYSPGRRMRLLATNTLSSERVRTVRLAVLKSLAMSVGETCNIAIPERDGMFYLDRVETHWPLRIQLPVGTQVPFHCTASGKMYLSTLRTDYLERFLRNYALEKKTEHTITSPKALQEELACVRERGYSTDDQEFMPGMTAIAVPILDDRGRLLSTLSIHAPEQRRHLQELVGHLDELQRAAAELAQIVGR